MIHQANPTPSPMKLNSFALREDTNAPAMSPACTCPFTRAANTTATMPSGKQQISVMIANTR
jgi:hypothetical protein